MFNMYSVLLIVVNACLLLLNAKASPIRTTTVYDALQITPLPLAAESHRVRFLSLSFELCRDNVHSAGCEPPARLTKRSEPTEPALLCGGKNCNIIAGECVCHHLDPEWPRIWRYPSKTISRRPEDKPNPIPTPTEIETSAAGHTVEHAFPFVLDSRLIEEIEDKPTPTLKPVELSSEEYRRILGVMASEAAVKAAEAHHTLSSRDNEEELRKCHKSRDCNKWHNTFPPPAQPGVVSKTDIGHPTLSHRDDEAEPTATQTSTPIQTPTPTTTMPPCDPLESECPNPWLYRCNPVENDCIWETMMPATKEEPSPTQTAVLQECPENDRQCQGHSLFEPPPYPPAKSEEEKRDVDVVIPSAASAMKINPECTLPPFLCL